MKKSNVIMISTFLIALGLISKAFILNEGMKVFLIIFFCVGCCVGLLRLFVNSQIKKMRGKNLGRKVLFFAILLGIGLPFQNWFRVNVLFSMDKSYLPWTITMMVLGAVFITFFFGFMKTKLSKKEESNEKISKTA